MDSHHMPQRQQRRGCIFYKLSQLARIIDVFRLNKKGFSILFLEKSLILLHSLIIFRLSNLWNVLSMHFGKNSKLFRFVFHKLFAVLQLYIKQMTSILQKAAKYRRISTILVQGEAHLRDPLMPPPQLLKPNPSTKAPSPDDVTDFPSYKTIPIPESIGYREGKYRPPSVPLITGWFPYNTYLQQGKVYNWCSCGLSLKNPDCDGTCNAAVTRCRPVQFNVSESGYYKLCNCKNSANAPFCNGTHRDLIKFHHATHRGFYQIWGYLGFWAGCVYMYWNWYT